MSYDQVNRQRQIAVADAGASAVVLFDSTGKVHGTAYLKTLRITLNGHAGHRQLYTRFGQQAV